MRHGSRLRRLAVAVALIPLAVPAPPASAADSFNRAAAVAYADRWVQEGQTLRNPDYYSFSNDCTNYVSQVWKAAGVMERYYSSPYWYGRRALGTHTPSWTVVDAFGKYMVEYYKIASYRTATVSSNYNPAAQGDAIMWDFGGGRFGHNTVEINWTSSYYYQGKQYAGDYINQHTNDREHAPWNYGWRMERDPDRRSRYRATVVHFNG